MSQLWRALFLRERSTILASRVIWVFAVACLCFGAFIALGSSGEGTTAVWLALPLVLYALPLIGLLAGVAAVQGDAPEELLLASRISGMGRRLIVKWMLWSLLLGCVALMWILPAVIRTEQWGALPRLWGYAQAEAAVFVAWGLLIGRFIRDSVSAHLAALFAGFFALIGVGIVAWLAARLPVVQAQPSLWTFALMVHPVEALRVGLLFSIDELPFDPSQLPALAAWWLPRPGIWYALIALFWSTFALLLSTVFRKNPE